ncbi:hypothetical protein OH76DRAFT_1560346, partial [Lentinus brumalis]
MIPAVQVRRAAGTPSPLLTDVVHGAPAFASCPAPCKPRLRVSQSSSGGEARGLASSSDSLVRMAAGNR